MKFDLIIAALQNIICTNFFLKLCIQLQSEVTIKVKELILQHYNKNLTNINVYISSS